MSKTAGRSAGVSTGQSIPSRGAQDYSFRPHVLSVTDPRYPRLLKEIPDPPRRLWIRGTGAKISLSKTIAVVGTRHPTPYGQEVAAQLVCGLVAHGWTIVSGLALGIDTIAHRTAIRCGGKTIAVLGCGIDIIAPRGNASLYWDIARGHGAILTEIPPGERTHKKRFVTRNRIISGLSLGVLVIEGTDHSGTLITARYAADQGREVFAVPGQVTNPESRAASILLQNGAKLVQSASDITEEFTDL